jgi:hypothetical protein
MAAEDDSGRSPPDNHESRPGKGGPATIPDEGYRLRVSGDSKPESALMAWRRERGVAKRAAAAGEMAS